MSTSEHLAAAIAALAHLKRDDGASPNPHITVHGSTAAVECVGGLPHGRRRMSHIFNDNGGAERYEVAEAHVDGVRVTAFGPHREVKVVDA